MALPSRVSGLKYIGRVVAGSINPLRRINTSAYQSIIVESKGKDANVALITLNRPKALNALNNQLVTELNDALRQIETDPSHAVVVITGSEKAFAAGADIKEMKDQTFSTTYSSNMLNRWAGVYEFRKPTIAAVSGYALGGGCELAMMCDIIFASPSAVFGQPEINLGVIPGAGGTQRLLRAIGKSRTMELILTGRQFSAKDASDWGLVSKVIEEGSMLDHALQTAETIATKGILSTIAAKEAIKAGDELALSQGLQFERRLFHALFSTDDQKEGMNAFVERRKAKFRNQ